MRRFFALLLLSVLLSGCTAPATVQTGEGYYTFSDSTGETVILPRKPEKVAVLFSSFAEVWLLSGGTVSVTVGEAVSAAVEPAAGEKCERCWKVLPTVSECLCPRCATVVKSLI